MNAKELLEKATVETIVYQGGKYAGSVQEVVVMQIFDYSQALALLDQPCEWKKTGMNRWHTSCGHNPLMVSISELGFCPYKGCGQPIKEITNG
jgi:hypothetical protein